MTLSSSALLSASDEALLVGYAASDPSAAAAFVQRFQRRVYGLALRIVGEPRAAEDVAQEAMLRAWRNGESFDARRGSVVTWLLTITRNTAIDALRVRRPVAMDPDDLLWVTSVVERHDPGDIAEHYSDIERLRIALTTLPAEQARAIVMAGIWGLTGREIAEHEDIPLGTAKTRIRTGLRRLQVAMAETQPVR